MADDSVFISRGWGDGRVAQVPVASLHGFHMATSSGGVNASLPRPTLAAFVSCDELGDQEFGHSCRHGVGPHEIKVLIFRSHNTPGTYKQLRALGDDESSRQGNPA